MAVDINEIAELFGIPIPKKTEGNTPDVETSDSYGQKDDASSNVSFDEKVVELKTDIKDQVTYTDPVLLNKSPKENKLNNKEIIVNTLQDKGTKESTGPIVKKTKEQEVVSEYNKDPENVENIVQNGDNNDDNNIEDLGINNETSIEQVDVIDHLPGKDFSTIQFTSSNDWRLKSPAPKYDYFYEKKAEIINDACGGKQLDIEKYRQELREASVDISMPTFNEELIYQKMNAVQKWKDRIKEIQVNVNFQYFIFSRNIELMRGILSRTELEKPAQRQDGVIYEHMYDVELYYSKLVSLHRSAEVVIENLKSASECLSRKVTISLPDKKIERYFNDKYSAQAPVPVSNLPVETHEDIPEELKNYDDVSDKTNDKISKDDEDDIFAGTKNNWDEI